MSSYVDFHLTALPGACYNCQDDKHVTDASHDGLCLLDRGHTDDPTVISTTFSMVISDADVLHGATSSVEVAAPSPEAIPVVDNTWMYACCKSAPLTSAQRGVCVRMKSLAYFQSFICSMYAATTPGGMTRRECLQQPNVASLLNTQACGNYTSIYSVNNNNNTDWSTYNRRRLLQMGTGQSACLTAQYKSTLGDAPCAYCPSGASTIHPWNAAVGIEQCRCLPGYYAEHNDQSALLRCTPCPVNTYITYPSNGNEACQACPSGTQTLAAGSAYCTCVPGTFRVTGADGLTQCVECLINSYCIGEQAIPCPPHSTSAVGQSSPDGCLCVAGYYLSMRGVCSALPLGVTCLPGAGMVQSHGTCTCSTGWDVNWIGAQMYCTVAASHCAAGKYVNVSADGAISGCTPCPLNTYSAGAQTVYNPLKGLDQQCTPCPLNFRTSGVGNTDLSACRCTTGATIRAVGNASAACGTCEANTFYEPLTQSCVACPNGMVATVSGCMCGAGWRLVGPMTCAMCPLGYYSKGASAACVQCPAGQTTLAQGQKWCVCASNGLPPRMGMCV